jgi:tetratricopeptide (TPR) repeat protein
MTQFARALVVLLVLIGGGLGISILVSAWRLPFERRVTIVDPASRGSAAAAEARIAALKEQIDAYSNRVDSLDKMITILVGLSTLYAVALGVTSYLNVNQVLEQSRSTAAQVEKMRGEIAESLATSQAHALGVKRLRDRLDRERPELQRLGTALRDAVRTLNKYLPEHLERDKHRFDDQEIQEIQEAERLSGVVRHIGAPPRVSRMLSGLGRFYSVRASLAPPAEQNQLLQRARYYLSRAVRIDPDNFIALNDLAFVLEDLGDLAGSERFWQQSLERQKAQQRARYNLAKFAERRNDFEAAERLLAGALSETKWQSAPNEERMKDILYNHACYCSRLGTKTNDVRWADAAVESLQKLQPFTGEQRTILPEDVKPGSALHWTCMKRQAEMSALLQTVGVAFPPPA